MDARSGDDGTPTATPGRRPGPVAIVGSAGLVAFVVVGVLLTTALERFPEAPAGMAVSIALASLYASVLGVAAFANRDARGREAARLRRASEDDLTGLPNRERFLDHLDWLVSRPDRGGVTLMLIDIDGFQTINETVGRDRGDLVLERIAMRLSGRVRNDDLVARVGGDEFAIAVDGLTSETDLARVASRFLGVMTEAVSFDDVRLDVRCSVGISRFPDHGASAAALLRCADIALYAAKRNRSVIEIYDPALDHFSPDALELAAEVQRGVAEGQFVLEYQPQVAVSSGALTGFEALVRWNHPTRGRVPPASFMPAVAALTVSRDLTQHVLELAAEQIAAWRGRGLEVPVAINVGARDASDPRLPRVLADVVDRHGLASRDLAIEVSEDAILANPDQSRVVLGEVARRGGRVTIDGFGAGVASMKGLSTLPVAAVKLDRGVVGAVEEDPRAEAVVRNAVELGHALGLEVIAEASAADETLSAAVRLGCDVVQGYGVEGPLPPAEIDRRLAAGEELSPLSARAAA